MTDGVTLLTFFVLSVFVGFEVVSKVSSVLHTPLMSGANAIHGVILVGAVIVTGHADGALAVTIGLVAVVLATVNMVGGFVVTDRMLEMFGRGPARRAAQGRRVNVIGPTAEALGYLVAAVCFILALKGLSSPKTARQGNWLGAAGALLACVVVFLAEDLDHMGPILVAIAVGTAVGVPAARRVAMTQMPQLVALFNGVGGAAAALVAAWSSTPAPGARRRRPRSPGRSPCWSVRCPSPARASRSPSCRS